jgi:hypothetical protein
MITLMALTGYNVRGRPRVEADINWGTTDPAQFYYDRFFEACRTLSSPECRALANGLKVSLRTVYNWRNSRNFPLQLGAALVVMDWVAAGKPTKLVSQSKLLARVR